MYYPYVCRPKQFDLSFPLSFPLDWALDCEGGFNKYYAIKDCNPLLATDPNVQSAQEGRPVVQRTVKEFTGTQHVTTGLVLGAPSELDITYVFTTTDLTVSAILFDARNSDTDGLVLRINSSQLRFEINTIVIPVTGLTVNTWHTVRLVWDGTEALVYVDGSLLSTTPATTTLNITTALVIGARSFTSQALPWTGRLGLVSIAGLVQYDFTEPTGATIAKDASGNGNDGTYVNNPASVIDNTCPHDPLNTRGFTEGTGSNGAAIGEYIVARADNPLIDVLGNTTQWPNSGYAHDWLRTGSNALAFTGTEYVTITNTTDYSSGWDCELSIKFDSLPLNTDFISQEDGNGVGRSWLRTLSNGDLDTYLGNSSHVLKSGLTTGVWYTIIVSYDGVTLTGTIDGGSFNNAALTPASVSMEAADGDLVVGASKNKANKLIGSISNVTINGSTYPLAEGAGDIAYDSSGNGNHGTLVNAPANTLQDVVHSNLDNGFSLYEHASLDPIRVPFGDDGNPLVITPQTGYTLTDHFPAIENGHNGAEPVFDFRTADDEQKTPAVNLADPTLPDTYTFGDPQTANFQFATDEHGNTSRFLAFDAAPDVACQVEIDKYHDI